MPRHTVTVTRIWATTRYRKDELQDLSNLEGADVLQLARAYFEAVPPSNLVDRSKERYVSIGDVRPSGRTILLDLEAGPFGGTGHTRDVNTGESVHERSADHAPSTSVRALIALPERSTSLLIFVEHVGGSSASWAIIKPFERWLRKRFANYTWSQRTLVETAAWLEGAQLTEVSAVLYGHSPDIADDEVPPIVGNLKHVLTPPRGAKWFPPALWEGLRNGRVARAALFGLEDSDVDTVTVEMEKDGRSKRFALGNAGTPLASWMISDSGEPQPTLEEARDFMLAIAPEVFGPVGADWQASDAWGDWSADALAMHVEVEVETA